MVRVLKIILLLLIVLNIIFMFLFINTKEQNLDDVDVAQVDVTENLDYVFSKKKVDNALLVLSKKAKMEQEAQKLLEEKNLLNKKQQMESLRIQMLSADLDQQILEDDLDKIKNVSRALPKGIEITKIKSLDEAEKMKASLMREINQNAQLRKKSLFQKIDHNKKKALNAQEERVQQALKLAKEKNLQQEITAKLKLAQEQATKKKVAAVQAAKLLVLKKANEAKVLLAKELAFKKKAEERQAAKILVQKKASEAKLQLVKELGLKEKAAELLAAKILAQEKAKAVKLQLAKEFALKEKTAEIQAAKILAQKKANEIELLMAQELVLKQKAAASQAVKLLALQREQEAQLKKANRLELKYQIYNPKNLKIQGKAWMQWTSNTSLTVRYPKSWLTWTQGGKLYQDHLEFWLDLDGIEPKVSYGNISYQLGIGLGHELWIHDFLGSKDSFHLEIQQRSDGNYNELIITNIPTSLKAYNLVFSKSSGERLKEQGILLSASESFRWGDQSTLLKR